MGLVWKCLWISIDMSWFRRVTGTLQFTLGYLQSFPNPNAVLTAATLWCCHHCVTVQMVCPGLFFFSTNSGLNGNGSALVTSIRGTVFHICNFWQSVNLAFYGFLLPALWRSDLLIAHPIWTVDLSGSSTVITGMYTFAGHCSKSHYMRQVNVKINVVIQKRSCKISR